ncbi:hypothetical protein D3C76_1585430 [compost metagenome]
MGDNPIKNLARSFRNNGDQSYYLGARYKQSIYQYWKDGEISHKDYRNMQEDYERQIEAINKVMGNLYEEKAELFL